MFGSSRKTPSASHFRAQTPKLRIGIEAGHTSTSKGAPPCEAGQKGEEIITLEIAAVLKQELVDRGYEVDIFRGDEPNTLPKAQISGYDADAFIALHADYCAAGRTGFKVSRYGGTPGTGKNGSGDDSDRFIDALWEEYYSATLLPKNEATSNFTLCMTHYWALNPVKHGLIGVRPPGEQCKLEPAEYAGITANTPGAIIEMGWISGDYDFMTSSSGQERMAQGIANAIDKLFGKTPQPPVDVFMLVDLSGSFYDDLPVFKSQAPQIISSLKSSNPDIRFGLGSYEDYPIWPFGDAGYGDVAYRRNIDLTFDTAAVETVIDGLFVRSGYDLPQSQLPALYQAATGAGQDLSGVGYPGASIPSGQQANFRDGAKKIFLLWTDASFHYPGDSGAIPYPGPSFEDTVNAIKALDPPIVIGISSGGGGYSDLAAMASATGALAPSGGVDCDGDGAIDILEGEPLVCNIAYSGEGIGEAIVALVGAAGGINHPPSLTVPDSQTVHYGNSLSFDVSATDLDNASNTLVFSATGLPNNLTLTNNGNGTATVSGIVNAAPGTYTAEITVTDPGGLSDTKPVTIEVVYSVPTLPVLDNFNRIDGAIGTNWLGNKSRYRIYNNQLRLTYFGTATDIFWKTPFGADQEAYVTFAKISATTKEQSLLLKAQSNRTWGNGVLEVQYNPGLNTVQVFTWEWPKGWVKYGDDIPVTFMDGDTFGARARPDGIVEIYRNGELLGTRDVSSWQYYSKGGYIGLWVLGTRNTILDDFGGGTVPAFP